jgi:hypothetical protein
MALNAFFLREVLCELPVSAFRSCLSKEIPEALPPFFGKISLGVSKSGS